MLKDCTQNANRYKFALTCMKLNKFQEAEKALLNKRQARPLQQHETQAQALSQVPNGAAGLYLLGQVYERQIKRREAVEMYKQAVSQDPTLWCAFERLCRLQIHTIDASKVFNEQHPSLQRMNQAIREFMASQASKPNTPVVAGNQARSPANKDSNDMKENEMIIKRGPSLAEDISVNAGIINSS